MTTEQTTSRLRRGYEWAVLIVACVLLGPFVLPYAIDIAAAVEGWRPWAIVALPMVGLMAYTYVTLQFISPLDVGLQIALMLAVGVMVVLTERAGFRGFRTV